MEVSFRQRMPLGLLVEFEVELVQEALHEPMVSLSWDEDATVKMPPHEARQLAAALNTAADLAERVDKHG